MLHPQILPEEDLCWRAVEARDPAYEGNLYYGVRSTGIYCRPTCPSRRPRRDQVAYFSTWQARKPGLSGLPALPAARRHRPAIEMVRQARRILEAADAPLSLDELGRQLGVSHIIFSERLNRSRACRRASTQPRCARRNLSISFNAARKSPGRCTRLDMAPAAAYTRTQPATWG